MDGTGTHPEADEASERLAKAEAEREVQTAASRSASDDWEAAHANARRVLVETIEDQLNNLVRDRDEPGKTKFRVGTASASGKQSLGRVTVGLTDSVELLRSRSEGDRRTWALTFHVCWRPGSDTGRVGFFAELDVREFDGRPVGQCRGLIGRKPTGRGYTLTSTDVTLFEQPPDGWLASDADIRKAVSELFAAFLDAIGKGTDIFVQSRLAEKSRSGRPVR